MPNQPIAAPTDRLTALINQVLDGLIKGLAAQAIITDAKTSEPWLNLPVFSWLLKTIVTAAAANFDAITEKNIDVFTVRFQNSADLDAYNAILSKVNTGVPNAQDIAAAKAAIDQLVSRTK